MELMLREIGAASVVAALREQNSPTRTLIFTASRHETALIDAMRMRPHGFVHKDESSPAIWNALHIVVRGGFAVSATLGPLHERALSGEPGLVLTSRERAVLQMIAEGQPNKAMARALVTSDRMIERARENLMKKLNAHDIATVTRIAVQMGLV